MPERMAPQDPAEETTSVPRKAMPAGRTTRAALPIVGTEPPSAPVPPPRVIAPGLGELAAPPPRRSLAKAPPHRHEHPGIAPELPSVPLHAIDPPKARGSIALALGQPTAGASVPEAPPVVPVAPTPAEAPAPKTPPPPPGPMELADVVGWMASASPPALSTPLSPGIEAAMLDLLRWPVAATPAATSVAVSMEEEEESAAAYRTSASCSATFPCLG